MRQLKDFFHHLFFPRESNNHRSRLLHHKSLLILITGFLLGNFLIHFGEQTYPNVLGISHSVTVEDLLLHTNQKRAEAGLPPLQLNAELSNAAAGKAQDMIVKNYWAHTSPDGVTPWAFIKGAGYEYIYAGENLARGFTTAQDVVNAWMASPGHRENILSKNYNDIGFAITTGSLSGDETVLVVQEFGSRVAQTAEKETTSIAVVPSPVSYQVAAQEANVISTPTPTAIAVPTIPEEQPIVVASVDNQPLINTKSMSTSVSLILVGLMIIVLFLDLWVVQKKNIVRAVAHNMDHIIFLGIIMAAVILFSRGSIL